MIIAGGRKVQNVFTHRWSVMCSLSHWPFTCPSLPLLLSPSLSHSLSSSPPLSLWHMQRGTSGVERVAGWGWQGRVGRWWQGYVHGGLWIWPPSYSIVGPCPVLGTCDSISVSGINVSLRSTFWIIALCRHPATSCQQHRLSVLSHSSAPCTYIAENKLSMQESTWYFFIIITKPFP